MLIGGTECMRLEQLYYFAKIYDEKSISKAAEQLFVSQPALSIAISNLEKSWAYGFLTAIAMAFPLLLRASALLALCEKSFIMWIISTKVCISKTLCRNCIF